MVVQRFTGKLNRLVHLQYEGPDVRQEDVLLSADDVVGQLYRHDGTTLFLGHYTRERITQALEEVGILDRLRAKGYEDLIIGVSSLDRFDHRLNIHVDRRSPETLIGQIVLREGVFRPKRQPLPRRPIERLNLLFIEWILMQDIRGAFTPDRKRLPGQSYPGLGVGRQVVELLVRVALQMKKEGILNCPEYFHNARFYSTRASFLFLDPRRQALMDVIRRDLPDLNVADLSFAVHHGCVVDRDSRAPLAWEAAEQIHPVSEPLTAYFASREYRRAYERAMAARTVALDETKFAAAMARPQEV